jgi:hypothetical protein
METDKETGATKYCLNCDYCKMAEVVSMQFHCLLAKCDINKEEPDKSVCDKWKYKWS